MQRFYNITRSLIINNMRLQRMNSPFHYRNLMDPPDLGDTKPYWTLSERQLKFKLDQLTSQIQTLKSRTQDLSKKFDVACDDNRLDDAANSMKELDLQRKTNFELLAELHLRQRQISTCLHWLDLNRIGVLPFSIEAEQFYDHRRQHGIAMETFIKALPIFPMSTQQSSWSRRLLDYFRAR